MSLVPGISFKATDEHEEIGFDLVEMGEVAYFYDKRASVLTLGEGTKGEAREESDPASVDQTPPSTD